MRTQRPQRSAAHGLLIAPLPWAVAAVVLTMPWPAPAQVVVDGPRSSTVTRHTGTAEDATQGSEAFVRVHGGRAEQTPELRDAAAELRTDTRTWSLLGTWMDATGAYVDLQVGYGAIKGRKRALVERDLEGGQVMEVARPPWQPLAGFGRDRLAVQGGRLALGAGTAVAAGLAAGRGGSVQRQRRSAGGRSPRVAHCTRAVHPLSSAT